MSEEIVAHMRGLLAFYTAKLSEWDEVGRTYDCETFEHRGSIVRDIRWLEDALA